MDVTLTEIEMRAIKDRCDKLESAVRLARGAILAAAEVFDALGLADESNEQFATAGELSLLVGEGEQVT